MCYSNVVPTTRRFSDIRLQKCRDVENRVMGPSRALKMSPFDRVTSYWCSIVTMALSRIVPDIFNGEKYHDLKILVKGQSTSLKVAPFDRLYMVCYYCPIVTLSLRHTVFEVFDFNKWCDLENWGMGPSMSLECHISIKRIRLPIDVL